MTDTKVAIIVQGLFEKSDSIGYDAVFEYNLLRKSFGSDKVHLFALHFDLARYPGVDIQPMEAFHAFLADNLDALVIYHYCDGWPEFDNFIRESNRPFIIRWHNNTPPWFYAANHRRSVERTIRGFRTIAELIKSPNVRFWVNSNFTLNQLVALGAAPGQASVVFPGSRFLEARSAQKRTPVVFGKVSPNTALTLLFVSRVVAHKGHKHIIRLAAYLQNVIGRNVLVRFIGRADPSSSFFCELQELAIGEAVDVELTGEVTEEELREAYSSADLFVCFSEHEGFGMPIFEAMRMGIPVLCWGRTALRELMQDHPFTFEHVDLEAAAAAIALLEEHEVREAIETIQQQILATYTLQVVETQIKQAMEGIGGYWQYPQMEDHSLPNSLRRRIFDRKVELPRPTDAHGIPMDFGDNYVTLYDVEAYEALLAVDHRIALLPEQTVAADFVTYSYREFISPKGHKNSAGLTFSANNQVTTHLVYGPYANFVRGYFSADFEIEVERSGEGSVELEFDVAVEGSGILAARSLTGEKLRNLQHVQLLFPISRNNSAVEFRIRVKRRGNCHFLFKGVTVRNMRQAIRDLPQYSAAKNSVPRWMPRLVRPKGETVLLSSGAKDQFRLGDAARDRGFWNDAAAAYSAGLQIQPRAFQYHVQLGNCLKEAGCIVESEDAYLAALALDPDDRDANLQVGRLYRQSGNSEAAQFHLLKAARLESSAAEAMHELAAMGFDISSLPDVFD